MKALALVLGVAVISTSQMVHAGQAVPAEERTKGSLIPVFSTAMDTPNFVFDYTNNSTESINLMEMMEKSSIVFNASEYSCHTLIWAGPTQLQVSKTWKGKIGLSAYLPHDLWEKNGYSEALKRWRWKCLLEPGRHTLTVKFGGLEYGPLTFVWEPVPLLFE